MDRSSGRRCLHRQRPAATSSMKASHARHGAPRRACLDLVTGLPRRRSAPRTASRAASSSSTRKPSPVPPFGEALSRQNPRLANQMPEETRTIASAQPRLLGQPGSRGNLASVGCVLGGSNAPRKGTLDHIPVGAHVPRTKAPSPEPGQRRPHAAHPGKPRRGPRRHPGPREGSKALPRASARMIPTPTVAGEHRSRVASMSRVPSEGARSACSIRKDLAHRSRYRRDSATAATRRPPHADGEVYAAALALREGHRHQPPDGRKARHGVKP